MIRRAGVLKPNKLASQLFTPGQLRAVEDFMTPPEFATVWVVEEGAVWEAYKITSRYQGITAMYEVSTSPDSPPVPGYFAHGVDAFDTELEAIQAARKQVGGAIATLLPRAKALARREREITGEENPADE